MQAEATGSKGLALQDCLTSDSQTKWTLPKKVIPVRREQRLKRLLRQQLISFYDLGPVIEPFDVIVGHALSRKNLHGELKVIPDFPPRKHQIFPFAVPYLRLPLLPSSRNELVRISHLLTNCELFPWQLQTSSWSLKGSET